MIEIENKANNKNKTNKITIILSVIFISLIFITFITILIPSNKKNEEQNINQTKIQVAIGETFQIDGLNYTIESYEFRYFAHKGDFRAESGKIWLMVNAKIENPTTERKIYDNSVNCYYITDAGEAKYNQKYYNYSEWLSASNYLDPFETATGYYMFSIPENVAPEPDGNYSYSIGGKTNSTKGKNFEIRMQKNKINAEEIFIIKL